MREGERLALAQSAIAGSDGAVDIEAVVVDADRALTRFTHNAIHQNLAESSVNVRIRAVVDGRAGVASTNARDPRALAETRDRAIAQARLAPHPTTPVELPGPATYTPPSGAYDAATASAPPEWRAAAAAHAFAASEAAGSWAAGYVATSSEGIAIANTRGLRAAFSSTDAAMNVKCVGPDASGYAEGYARRRSGLDPMEIATVAARKARDAGVPQGIDPGDWTVILEPAAAGELLHYLLPHFSAENVDQGASFLSGGLDRPVAGRNVSILDDVRHPLHAGRPFDSEGSPTHPVTLIDAGIGRGFVTDSEWASRLHRDNTGHYAPEVSFATGPQVRHAVVVPGTRSRDELIATTKRGLLISRFWYIRNVDQRKTIVTGMTRDGTFLIEDGELRHGVRNLRFNVNILELLHACEFSSDQIKTGGYSYTMVVPSVRFDRFRFTSVTQF